MRNNNKGRIMQINRVPTMQMQGGSGNQQSYKYQFDLELLKLRAAIPIQCDMKVVWRRGPNNIATQQKVSNDGKAREPTDIIFNQVLSLIASCGYSRESKQFSPKQSEVIVCMEINGSPKKLGVFELNICSILNPYDCQGAASKLFDVKLAKCAFEKTNLVFKLSSYFLSDMPNEKASGNLVTGNGVLNTSNYSIGQDNRFNVIKDTLSVNSYSGNSTGIKYSSSTKKEQKGTKEESASKKGEHPLHSAEYGFSGQEAKRQSPGVGYEPRRSYRHTDNRTEINDGISISKQLTDEQNRRSKLQAELNKNNLYIEQLKNKLNELLMENGQLKEKGQQGGQLSQKYSQLQTENNNLHTRIYELNNEVRQGKSLYQSKKAQCERLEGELAEQRKHQTSPQMYQQYQQLLKQKESEVQRADNLSRINQNIQKEMQQLRVDKERISRAYQQAKAKLQEREAKTKLQVRESQALNESSKKVSQMVQQIEFYKREADRNKNNHDIILQGLQRNAKELNEQLMRKEKELNAKLQRIWQLEKDGEELKRRAAVEETDKQNMQKELTRIKSELSMKLQTEQSRPQVDYKIEYFTKQNKSLADRVSLLIKELEEKNSSLKTEREKHSDCVSKEKVQEMSHQKQVEIQRLTALAGRLQKDKQESDFFMTKVHEEANMRHRGNSETDRLMRECLQMQVELKFSRDQLAKLKGIEEQHEHEKWKADVEMNNRKEVEKDLERTEKQLANRNRAWLIETEKTKMLTLQIEQHVAVCSALQCERDEYRNIISSGEKQVCEMQQYIQNQQAAHKVQGEELARANANFKNVSVEVSSLKQQLVVAKQQLAAANEQLVRENQGLSRANQALRVKQLIRNNKSQQSQQMQTRVKELEERDQQKIVTLQKLNDNLALSTNEIKVLQQANQQKQKELSQKEALLADYIRKFQQLQQRRQQLEAEVSRSAQAANRHLAAKQSAEKQSQLMLEEMHLMKKRFEEEKTKTYLGKNEDNSRVRTLENQLQKREKVVSKLSKEKLELEEENVRMNVQVMKLLSEMEKIKSASNTGNSKSIQGSSYK